MVIGVKNRYDEFIMNKSVTNNYQPSLTEWLAAIGETEKATAFREEDNRKTERLEFLRKTIQLPYRVPTVFSALDAFNYTSEFQTFLAEHGEESCAFRLTPQDHTLPKFRNRGLTAKCCYEDWFKGLEIDFSHYTLSIFPNEQDIAWSTIFVVSRDMVFGEIIPGVHSQLTQGETVQKAFQFQYDFHDWQWSESNPEAQAEIEQVLAALKVDEAKTRTLLKKELEAEFSHNYVLGYFETTAPSGLPEQFIDYNRLLPSMIPQSVVVQASDQVLRGVVAFAGTATGRAVVVTEERLAKPFVFPEGGILISNNTDVRYLPYMQKAGALVTERGGMLSHAAIIARELGKPCLVGVKGLLAEVKEGDVVEVGSEGWVRVLQGV